MPQEHKRNFLWLGRYGRPAIVIHDKFAYTFGGVSPSSGSRSNCIYEVDLNTRTVKQLADEATANAPKGRSGSRMVLCNNTLIVFGGYTDDGRTNDVLAFDLITSESYRSI